MDFNNMIDSSRSQTRFYQLSCLALIGVLGLLAVVVPSSIKTGPYVIKEYESFSSVAVSQPWKVSVARIEGFLKTFLSLRFEWTKENFDTKKKALFEIVTERAASSLKDSTIAYGALAKAQDAKGYFVLEGYQFSNEKHVIEAKVSRIIRVGDTGVVTPLRVRLHYDDCAITENNPYGLRVNVLDESESNSITTSQPPSEGSR